MSHPVLNAAIAQANPLVGAVEANADQVIAWTAEARDRLHADVVLFPELMLTGYPPEDLLLRPGLHARLAEALQRICAAAHGITVLVGYPHQHGASLYNACAVIRDGRVAARYDKRCLPNYGVFDEKRYFAPGTAPLVVDVAGVRCGISICEDIWSPQPAADLATQGAAAILNINASPFHIGKHEERLGVIRERVRETGLPVLYANMVGGQDELVFDGRSLAANTGGEVCYQAPAFTPGLFAAPLPLTAAGCDELAARQIPDEEALTWQALITGVRDYVGKNGFQGAVIGLSGGIDSALTLAIAVDALGAGAVHAVMMPSRYTADISVEDARGQAAVLGVRYDVIPIEQPFTAFLGVLADAFAGLPADTTEENIQARCRGIILMALSNKHGRILLTTGNKSEMAVGYATLYGDMAGGFAPLKDVSKMLVYRLAAWRNRQPGGVVIPQRVIDRPPTAELAPDQKDSDSLPPYEILDAILERYIEHDQCAEDIVADGFDAAEVQRVTRLVNRNEYKRRQAAPGIKITRKAFGRERRYPITSGF